MWIIPKNILSAFSASAQATEDSTLVWPEHSEALAEECASALLWRSKPSPAQTWLQRWRRVSWMQHLSGRILKPSMERPFVDWWTSSLVAIRASHSAPLAFEQAPTTLDTFGRLYETLSKQLNLFGASSKTSQDTSVWDTTTFTKTFDLLVTQLSRDSLQRQKSALHTVGNGSSYWPTVEVHNTIGYQVANGKRYPRLGEMVKMYPTPSARDWRDGKASEETMARNSRPLNETLISGQFPTVPNSTPGSLPGPLWATPVAHDHNNQQTKYAQGGTPLTAQVATWPTPHANAGTGPGTQGKEGGANLQTRANGKLNPRWVETLMGIQIGWLMPSCTEPVTAESTSYASQETGAFLLR